MTMARAYRKLDFKGIAEHLGLHRLAVTIKERLSRESLMELCAELGKRSSRKR
jgi:hypothetical protein